MDVKVEDELYHIGKDHIESKSGDGSGRYPFGSGNRPHQHDWDLKSRIEKLKLGGCTPAEIAAQLGFYQENADGSIKRDKDGNPLGSTTKLRAQETLATSGVKNDEYAEVCWYDNHINPATGKHYTNREIGELMGGRNESSVRSIRETGLNGKKNKTQEVADKLREEAKKKGYIDIGTGSELFLGCSTEGLNAAIELLKTEGYRVEIARQNQVTNKAQQTTFKVLCSPDTEGDAPIQKHMTDIKMLDDPDPESHNNDMNKAAILASDPPQISLDRVQIRYDEQGGTKRDGMIEIRATRDENGKLVATSPDLSLGNAQYAQIRIAVEGNRYIKGMAVYNENLPEGVDILVNSNKSEAKGVNKALKEMKLNDDGTLASQPFGSTVVPTCVRNADGSPMLDKNGNQIRSAVNFVGANDDDAHVEGRWGSFSKNLPAQFLAKQTLPLVRNQLKLAAQISEQEFKEIMSMNNPTVKQQMLIDYADTVDRKAVDLKAAPIAGQRTRVLLAVDSLKDTECYCPGLESGTTVALVRFPHSGPHEIPICQVNNANREASGFMKNAPDAIGINKHVADRLSGADFDGDTVIVIPMTKKMSDGTFSKTTNIISNPVLPHMEGFDTSAAYSTDNPRFSSMQKMGADGKMHPTYKYFKTDKEKGREMGVISNLITDMYAKGCDDPEELSRALRYSMVVIDAKKHELNYTQAERDLGIKELKEKYQVKPDGSHGASSLLSAAKSPIKIDKRAIWQPTEAKVGSDGKVRGGIDPVTGEKVYQTPGKTEEWVRSTVKVTAPAGYVWRDSNGKAHRSKYMKDENGKVIEETTDGSVKQRADGSYYYDAGSGKTKWVNTGEKRKIQEEVPLMSIKKDARELLSANPTEIEQTYAVYANHMKNLGNKARLEAIKIHTDSGTDPVAKKKYAKEVAELKEALIVAKKNAPRERQANLLATSRINAIFSEDPDMDSDTRKKIRGQQMSDARKDTGAAKARVQFTEKQWEAVNAKAISTSMLKDLLRNADKKNYTNLALPKENRISDAQRALVKQLYAKNSGANWEEIAKRAGVSLSSIYNIINE